MSVKLPTPSVPDLARIKGNTVEEISKWLIDYFNESGGIFNYVRAIRAIRHSYKGYHQINHLVSSCDAEKTDVGRASNRELVLNIAPLAFGRSIQVFDLPHRKFSFGLRQAGFRVPFFFVEGGVIKLYYIQPRKRVALDPCEFGMIATIYKKYLLETEFFGENSDIEFVEACAPKGTNQRAVQRFHLEDLELWSERDLSDRLTLISHALDAVERSTEIRPRKRLSRIQAVDMPLFD